MKTHLTFFSAFFILLMSSSCKKDLNMDKYEQSYQAWLKFKKEMNNDYQYTVKTSSWTGTASETKLIINDGRVITRTYKFVTPDPSSPQSMITSETWNEDGSTLGSHQKGASIKTMDEIYAEIKSNWIVKRSKTTTYFETKNEGMVSLAGFVEDSCADDCFQGIDISQISGIVYCCGANVK